MTAERKDHVCPIEDCEVALKHHVLMCRPHWRMVPKHLQRDVNATWRATQRVMKQALSQPERVEAVRDYLIARREAVNLVNGRLAHE